MKYKHILVTGGAGFVGSNICIKLKEYYPHIEVTALDNLNRKGSELNLPRLEQCGVKFAKGDVRFRKDLDIKGIDLIIECSAEPSVMAGVTSSPEYLLDTNLIGAINCFEIARKNAADVIFLSTSRVYPVRLLNELNFVEEGSRFSLLEMQNINGASARGISEKFPLEGIRSLYGTTKLAAELILSEYIENYKIRGVITRFGLITGPWQMGKVDQGVVVLWLARHIFARPLEYIGFGGEGKQVRDILHVDDCFRAVRVQIENIERYSGKTFNLGGGVSNSLSLLELTNYCMKITGNTVIITKNEVNRAADVRIYISDCSYFNGLSGWKAEKDIPTTLEEIYRWIVENKDKLQHILE